MVHPWSAKLKLPCAACAELPGCQGAQFLHHHQGRPGAAFFGGDQAIIGGWCAILHGGSNVTNDRGRWLGILAETENRLIDS
jgi:hypothetical protein